MRDRAPMCWSTIIHREVHRGYLPVLAAQFTRWLLRLIVPGWCAEATYQF